MSEIDNWRADPDFAHALHHTRSELEAVEDLAERRGNSHAEARRENRTLAASLQNAMVALAERDDEIDALRKQAANLATALHKAEAERDGERGGPVSERIGGLVPGAGGPRDDADPIRKFTACLHPTWTFSGWGPRVFLKCSTCPAVIPICHECGQSVMPETSEEDW